MIAKTEVTVVMPGMAAIVSQAINNDAIPTYLSKLLAKARLTPMTGGLNRCLFNHFNQDPLLGTDLPMASLESHPSSDISIKVDPCYIHADRASLLLFSQGLTLTEQESHELIAEIQPLLDEIGVLKGQSAQSWSLHLSTPSLISFSALDEVEGKAVESYLPSGQDKRQWHRLWNEIQMQLYNADVNVRRIANKQLPINSVWFWGQGEFTPRYNHWTTIWGQSDILARLVDATSHQATYLPAGIPTTFSKGRHLGVLATLNTEADWQAQLDGLDKTIFEPLWTQLSTMAISKLILQVPEFGEYHLTPLRRWQFWS